MSLSKKAAKAKEPVIKKSIIQWCKTLHEAGNELTIKWEGGGDSGWAYFEIDGETTDNEYTRALVDHMYATLNYGSWAGEFNASGSAIYDPESNAFGGVDFYGEDEGDHIECDLKISIPKTLWFDQLHVECEANYDESTNMSVELLIKNGFLVQEHKDICSNLEESLGDEFDKLFSEYTSKNEEEFRGCTENWIADRADFLEKGDMLVYTIEGIDIQTTTNTERNIVLELTEETAEAIDQILNEKENAETE
jgi:hypothetical protein